MQNRIKELIDQATILSNKNNSKEISEYLVENNVISFPVGIGDVVYFLSTKTMFGSLLTHGVAVKREVDKIAYDGKVEIISYRENAVDNVGNLYGYWKETVFNNKAEAEEMLKELRKKSGL